MGELLNNVFLSDTRESLLRIAEVMKDRDHVQGIILAGRELPLLLSADTAFGMPLLDTTLIHVQTAVRQLWR
jgi:aspartate/glutamate racemase